MTIDLLRLPLLRRRYGRLLLQIPFALIALVLMYDGFTGTQRASDNLATVIPWVHYRGFAVLALLLVGNLFCMGCPFTLPRTLAKRLSIRGRRFPRPLRNKWIAIASLFTLFFVYEWLDLWASPALTAWVILAYFVASFVLEAVFSESAFCKYVCPLGTFNFVYSTVSPTQIKARNLDVCRTCVGHECVNGSYSEQPVIRINEIGGGQIIHDKNGTLGCGTLLFVPQIQSNMDCVMCLDCARACPHNNVGLMARVPGRELLADLPKRWDMALLLIGLTFFGILNAFGMIPPVYDLIERLSGFGGETTALLLIFIAGGVVLPVVSALGAGMLSRLLTRSAKKYDLRHIVASFAPAFVPLGFGIWIGHYGFHFLTGALTLIPVIQTFLIDHRIDILGSEPDWSLAVMPDSAFISLIQLVALMGGFIGSLVVAQRIAQRLYRRQAFAGLMPWAFLLLVLMLVTILVFSQPMEMRGMAG